MIYMIIYLLVILLISIVYIFKLEKTNRILHNNNINLGQALVDCGGLSRE